MREDILALIQEDHTFIKDIRENFGLTLTDLAGELDISPATISTHEMGHRKPQPIYLQHYAAAFAKLFKTEQDFRLFMADTKQARKEATQVD